MTGLILRITLPIFLAGAALLVPASRRIEPEQRRQLWLKFTVYFGVVHLVLATLIAGWSVALAALILAAGTVEVAWALRRVTSGQLRFAIGLAYLGLAAGFLVGAATLPREKLAFLYLVVAGFDGFSEVFGRLAGRTKLAQTISPGKTAEGAVAGGAGALILAAVARTIAGLPVSLSILFGAAIAVAALLGDLAASWVKRRAGIKNYSAVIPGHGGVLDRFDSFMGAGAAAGIATCVMPGLLH